MANKCAIWLIALFLSTICSVAGEPCGQMATAVPRLYIAGNSTAHNGEENGWGSHLQKYFDAEKLIVDNPARAGRSSRTFITEGWWDSPRQDLKPADYVIIQFGHNDAGEINDQRRARGSIAALGDETQEIDNQVTGAHEVVHTFGWYMRKMIDDAREKGATPVVLSMTARNVWPEGQIERDNRFCTLTRDIAAETGVAFIDLNQLICDHYDSLGQERVTALYFDGDETTHTNALGAHVNATCLVKGIRATDGLPLADYLKVVGPQ